MISYFQVKDYYSYPNDLVNISKVVQNLTSEDDKIVTDTQGDTTLLYLSNRRGAPSVYVSLPELKKKGYTYFVTMDKSVSDAVKKDGFRAIAENEKFTLFRL
jgi:hypothetical protein